MITQEELVQRGRKEEKGKSKDLGLTEGERGREGQVWHT